MNEARHPAPAPTQHTKPSALYIYAEGLERSFLDNDKFPDLTPNLQRLAKRALQIHGIRQVPFTGWTIAGQVASNCGFPGVEGGILFATDSSRWPCASNLLAQDGYTMSYLNGSSTNFSGKGTFWTERGYHRVLGDVAILDLAGHPDAPLSSWGAYDDMLMIAAWKEWQDLRQAQQPYVLTLLTVDTHAPGGLATPACSKLPHWIGKDGTSNPMLQSVHCADHLLGRFLDKVLAELPDNTYVVLQSDYLQPPRADAYTQLGPPDQRDNLFLAWGDNLSPRVLTRQATTFDIAPTFLSLLGRAPGAVNLGRDLLAEAPTLVEQHGMPWMEQRMKAALLDDRMANGRDVETLRSTEAAGRWQGKKPLFRETGDPVLRERAAQQAGKSGPDGQAPQH